MYRNSNTARKIENVRKSGKVIKLKNLRVKKYKEFRNKILVFFFSIIGFLVTAGAIFFFLVGQAKMNELTYKISQNSEKVSYESPKLEQETKKECKNTSIKTYATEDKVEIF